MDFALGIATEGFVEEEDDIEPLSVATAGYYYHHMLIVVGDQITIIPHFTLYSPDHSGGQGPIRYHSGRPNSPGIISNDDDEVLEIIIPGFLMMIRSRRLWK